MAKESFAEKMARKTFFSAPFQKSWGVHMQAFGPILKPAFAEDYQSRVHLAAALNAISNRNLAVGLAKLKSLESACVTDADRTAFYFFMGVLCEMAGNQEQMLACYSQANSFGHKFYMPYLKVGQLYLSCNICDQAEENFRAAIKCFDGDGPNAQGKLILGSAYANLATCLTMMHRYDEAEAALATSRQLYPDAPGRAAPEATLCAIRGDVAGVEQCLAALKAHTPDAYDSLKQSTDRILAGTDPFFFAVPVDEEKIAAFWQWFASYEAELTEKLSRQEYDTAMAPVAEHLLETFPFLEQPPYTGLGQNKAGNYVIELKDMYATGIIHAYEKLLAACPAEISSQWQFVVIH